MTSLIYSVAIYVYGLSISIATLWSTKARKWKRGRVDNLQRLATWRSTVEQQPLVWVHCASHGEYEQVLPLVERIRQEQPVTAIALTFFSPSGYEAVGETAPVDWVGYLPLDTRANARKWVDVLKPSVAIITKNEWWWHMISTLASAAIPLHQVSATIRADHYFLRYRSAYIDRCLTSLSSVGVVDEQSKRMLATKVEPAKIYVSGDLRADQVARVANLPDGSLLSRLPSTVEYIIYGSVWAEDIASMRQIMVLYPQHVHLVFPHRLESGYVDRLRMQLAASYLAADTIPGKGQILLVKEMGLLSRAYRYGKLAYVGGGYGEGVHNVLEAAVYNIPILVGPRHHKSAECLDLLEKGAVINMEQATQQQLKLVGMEDVQRSVRNVLAQYFQKAGQATEITYNHIFGPRSD